MTIRESILWAIVLTLVALPALAASTPDVSEEQLLQWAKMCAEADVNSDEILTQQEALAYWTKHEYRRLALEAYRDLPEGTALEQDVVYGSGEFGAAQTLDILYHSDQAKKRPAIVFIHGGGWSSGDKVVFSKLMGGYAEDGYVTMTINYRLSDVAPFPAAVDDCKLAIRWLRAHADKYGVDPKRIGATGHSAGGHLAAMMALVDDDDGFTIGYSAYSGRVQVAIPSSGVYSFMPDDVADMPEADGAINPFLKGKPSDVPEVARKASPVTYITKDDPPLLIFHGTDDPLVSVEQAKGFEQALKAAGADYQLVLIDGIQHDDAVAREGQHKEMAKAFFAKHLRPAGKTSKKSALSSLKN